MVVAWMLPSLPATNRGALWACKVRCASAQAYVTMLHANALWTRLLCHIHNWSSTTFFSACSNVP